MAERRIPIIIWVLIGWGAAGVVQGIAREFDILWPFTVATVLLIFAAVVVLRRATTGEDT